MDGDTRVLGPADAASSTEPALTPAAASIAAPAGVEKVKLASRQLRGTIAQTLADQGADRFSEDDYNLLKFHGVHRPRKMRFLQTLVPSSLMACTPA